MEPQLASNIKEDTNLKLIESTKAQIETYKSLAFPLKSLYHEFDLAYIKQVDLAPSFYINPSSGTTALECESILESMENLLVSFQENIGAINTEIESLQQRSNSMKVELLNRSNIESRLAAILGNLVVLPELVESICEGDIDDDFTINIDILKNKLTYLREYEDIKDFKAIVDLKPQLELLRLKASSRIRDFLFEKTKEIRKLSLDINYFQNTSLVKYKSLNHFLIEKHPETAIEICDSYINTTRQYYYDNFDHYKNGLLRAITGLVEKEIKFGSSNESIVSSLFWSTKAVSNSGINTIFNNSGVSVENNYFSLGNRGAIIFDPEKRHLSLQHIEDSQKKIYMEEVFYNFNLALVENAVCEYDFVEKFFVTPRRSTKQSKGPISAEAEMASMIFSHIFEPVVGMGTSLVKQFISASYDAVGILLCIRSIPKLAQLMQYRQLPALDTYFNSLNMILWPKFQSLVDLHAERLLKISDPRHRSHKFDSYPHQVTRQYAEFISAILRLNQGFDAPALLTGLARLRVNMDKFLKNHSALASDRQLALIFLVNNDDQILFILKDNMVDQESGEYIYWQNQMNEAVYGVCEDFMNTHFGYLKSFMQKTGSASSRRSFSPDEMFQVAMRFNAEWRNEISNINTMVVPKFSNFVTGTAIVHDLLKQLIIIYTRFVTLHEEYFVGVAQGPETIAPVGVHNVMLEIKKYRPVF